MAGQDHDDGHGHRHHAAHGAHNTLEMEPTPSVYERTLQEYHEQAHQDQDVAEELKQVALAEHRLEVALEHAHEPVAAERVHRYVLEDLRESEKLLDHASLILNQSAQLRAEHEEEWCLRLTHELAGVRKAVGALFGAVVANVAATNAVRQEVEAAYGALSQELEHAHGTRVAVTTYELFVEFVRLILRLAPGHTAVHHAWIEQASIIEPLLH